MLNAIRTDLSLLLECLKCQMKHPSSQKQALLTIVSICQQNTGRNVEFLRELGGVNFIYNLSRASRHSEVQETALFTLSSLAEFNESCKQSLCREEMFCGLVDFMEQEVSLTLKRVAVYTLSVLVSNNKQGQSLAMSSGCVNVLLSLFRSVYPMTEGTDELLQLWTSVSSALCGCVNNPQNAENQRACMCVLPLVKVWLQQVRGVGTEVTRPICSFISMTVANNPSVQEYFSAVGGLFTLSHTLSRAVSQCRENPAACLLATIITRTLSACITDNDAVASVLSKLSLVPDLLLLLSSPNLVPRDQLAVVLTLGRCTDACVEHQSQLLQSGGLPLIISLLTDTNDEEVRKAATFVLQTCKKLTGSTAGQSVESDLQRHRQAAGEIQQRIQQLERRQMLTEHREELWKSEGEDVPQSFTPPTHSSPLEMSNQEPTRSSETVIKSIRAEHRDHQPRRESVRKNRGIKETERETNLRRDRRKDDLRNENPHCDTHNKRAEEHRNTCSQNIFKHPAAMKRHQQTQFHSEDELSVCSELLDSEIERILITPADSKPRKLRCAGCVSGVDEVNSRSMGVVLRSCKSQCEFHRVLRRAEDRLKEHRHTHDVGVMPSSGNISKHTLKEEQDHTNRRNLTDAVRLINLTPLKSSNKTQDVENRHASKIQGAVMMKNTVHRDRQDYSQDELRYLSDGVRRFGHSWNTILWAYPFQHGRTNVDLARKYRKLQQDSGSGRDLRTYGPEPRVH